MARNKVPKAEFIDEIVDGLVEAVKDRVSNALPEYDTAIDWQVIAVEFGRTIRDELPALWEWSSQETRMAELEAENARLRAKVERLADYAAEQMCECYNEYGKRLSDPCERCRLVYGHETWEEFERAAEDPFVAAARDQARRRERRNE